jgi:hypothetical protein
MNCPLRLIFKVPTEEENVQYTLRGYRTVCWPGRARDHPFADGLAALKLERQIPSAVIYKPRTTDQHNSGGQAQGSIASTADDTVPSFHESRI